MFTGIIESLGTVESIKTELDNIHFQIRSSISAELKIDQSVSHNGVCLTVTALADGTHSVTAIRETLNKTNLGQLTIGDSVNLERCLPMNGRLDGHLVQGHVDQVATCTSVVNESGSWRYTFEYDPQASNITVEKGSVCVNGVSLTVVDSGQNSFSVAIIPFTYEHTNFKALKVSSSVNIEFDILGKYIAKLFQMSR